MDTAKRAGSGEGRKQERHAMPLTHGSTSVGSMSVPISLVLVVYL